MSTRKAPWPPFKAVSRESFFYLNSNSSSMFIKSMASDGGSPFVSLSHLRSQGMSTPLCKLSASTCSCILLVVSPSRLFAQQSTTRKVRCPPQSEVSGLQICGLIYIRWLRVLGDGVVGAGPEGGYIMLLVGVRLLVFFCGNFAPNGIGFCSERNWIFCCFSTGFVI